MTVNKIETKYIAKLKNGDKEAFEVIYNHYHDALYYFALTLLKNTSDAEEITQEVFIKVFENVRDLRKNSSFHSWVFSITFNLSTNLLKKRNKFVSLGEDTNLEEIIQADKSVIQEVEQKEVLAVVQEEIGKMSFKFSQIAFLHYFEGFSVREISEIMDIPLGTVKTRLSKVRSTIKPALTRRGFTPSKYFSFALAPVVAEAFQQIIEKNQMARETSSAIFQNISETTVLSSATLGVGDFIFNSLTIKVLTTSAVVFGTGAMGYHEINNDSHIIEAISYYDQLTNRTIEVEVSLRQVNKVNDISIQRQGKEIPFRIDQNKLIFLAENNGIYSILADDVVERVEITNIDKEYPSLILAESEEDVLTLNMDDNIGVNFEKSHILSDGEKIRIPADGVVKNDLKYPITVVVEDFAGNQRTYKVEESVL